MITTAALENLHFETPPINEVVCGLVFDQVQGFLNPHLGALWDRYKPEFSVCKELAPLSTMIEGSSNPNAEGESESQFLELPTMPRIWFEEEKGNGLIQVQKNRFHYNWRRKSTDDEYPHFETVFALFKEKLGIFQNLLNDLRTDELAVKQFELTYVNLIELPESISSVIDMGRVFSDFSWRNHAGRLNPESANWLMTFRLPDENGRLNVNIRSATRISDDKPIILFELTARGFGGDHTMKGIDEWFRIAHESIVRVFVELTTQDIQESAWGLKK